jgi:opacity protein-like surface antigen
MKKLILCLLATSSIAVNALAEAEDKNKCYFRFDAGQSQMQKLNNGQEYPNYKPKRANVFDVGVGYYVNDHFRADITFSNRDYKINSEISTGPETNQSATNQKIRSTALMLNGYYDIGTFGNFTPYLSAGVGVALNKAGELDYAFSEGNISYSQQTTTNLAYQIGAGTAVKLTDRVSLDFNYKFLNMGSAKTGRGLSVPTSTGGISAQNPVTAKLKAHEFMAGIRFDF